MIEAGFAIISSFYPIIQYCLHIILSQFFSHHCRLLQGFASYKLTENSITDDAFNRQSGFDCPGVILVPSFTNQG
jgi:hypothetical protein